MSTCLLAGLRLGFGAEEAGNLLGEAEERGAACRETNGIVVEALAPDGFDVWDDVLFSQIRSRKSADRCEELLGLMVILIHRRSVCDKVLSIGIADEFFDGFEVGRRWPRGAHALVVLDPLAKCLHDFPEHLRPPVPDEFSIAKVAADPSGVV